MAAEALNKAGAKMGVTIKVETNGSDGAKNLLTKDEIANCDGIIVAAEKKIETARFDGKPVLFTRVDDGIHKPEELIHKITSGEVPEFHAKGGAQASEDASASDPGGSDGVPAKTDEPHGQQRGVSRHDEIGRAHV